MSSLEPVDGVNPVEGHQRNNNQNEPTMADALGPVSEGNAVTEMPAGGNGPIPIFVEDVDSTPAGENGPAPIVVVDLDSTPPSSPLRENGPARIVVVDLDSTPPSSPLRENGPAPIVVVDIDSTPPSSPSGGNNGPVNDGYQGRPEALVESTETLQRTDSRYKDVIARLDVVKEKRRALILEISQMSISAEAVFKKMRDLRNELENRSQQPQQPQSVPARDLDTITIQVAKEVVQVLMAELETVFNTRSHPAQNGPPSQEDQGQSHEAPGSSAGLRSQQRQVELIPSLNAAHCQKGLVSNTNEGPGPLPGPSRAITAGRSPPKVQKIDPSAGFRKSADVNTEEADAESDDSEGSTVKVSETISDTSSSSMFVPDTKAAVGWPKGERRTGRTRNATSSLASSTSKTLSKRKRQKESFLQPRQVPAPRYLFRQNIHCIWYKESDTDSEE